MKRRIRLGVIFGGRSREHEVSVSSARSLIGAIDPDRFDVVPIGITKSGVWLMGDSLKLLDSAEISAEAADTSEMVADVTRHGLVRVDHGEIDAGRSAVDVVFPLLHGPYGEDGTVQGLLELAGVPYVGAGVAASAVGMDKALMKALFEHTGLPVARYRTFSAREWRSASSDLLAEIEESLGFPVFVKPCRLGSSVGIAKAHSSEELRAGISDAVRYDNKIVVEEGIDGREIECGLLGNHDPSISVFGEVLPKHDFYDYEAKYTDGLAELLIPARLSLQEIQELTTIAFKAFKAIDVQGMARVDFFLERGTGRVVLNELNTIPGFAPTSMFPKLWEASGISYSSLVERLVELAIDRHGDRGSA